jgi:hypothetical protein
VNKSPEGRDKCRRLKEVKVAGSSDMKRTGWLIPSMPLICRVFKPVTPFAKDLDIRAGHTGELMGRACRYAAAESWEGALTSTGYSISTKAVEKKILVVYAWRMLKCS